MCLIAFHRPSILRLTAHVRRHAIIDNCTRNIREDHQGYFHVFLQVIEVVKGPVASAIEAKA